MKVKCKVLGLEGTPASDGSIIPRHVMEEYLSSDSYKEAIRQKSMLSSLTHRSRNLAAVYPENSALRATVGKDDSLIIVDKAAPTPTHYVEKLYIGDDGWLWADMVILDETLFDDIAKQNILRLKGLLRSGIKIHTSAVIVAYWDSQKSGIDIASRILAVKGVDITLNSSWKDSHIEEIIEDEKVNNKTFSEFETDDEIAKVKCFSNLEEFNISSPKTSKIGNQFSFLKVKSFSILSPLGISEEEVACEEPEQKEFSQAQVLERMRLGKLSPRIRFRRIIIDFRQALKSQGGIEKISPESLKTMKSLFATDVIGILQEISPMILQGKNLNALLGASSLGVSVRKAAQDLAIPYRLAMQENARSGFVSKARYQKIQDAYTKFVNALLEYVFGTPTNQKLKEEEDENEKS